MRRISANIALLFLSILFNSSVDGQDSTENYQPPKFRTTYKKTELVTGINWQGSGNGKDRMLRYVEIGMARSIHVEGFEAGASLGIIASEEIYFGDSIQVFGTKLGFYTHYMFDLGFSIVYYTDFKNSTLKLRPEFGIGMNGFRAIIGYNVPTINNKSFGLLRANKVQLTIQLLLSLRKKEVADDVSLYKLLFR